MDDQFTKLFRYMEDKFSRLERRLDETATKSDVELLWSAIDRLYGESDRLNTEQAAIEHHFFRVEDQIRGHELRLKVLERSN